MDNKIFTIYNLQSMTRGRVLRMMAYAGRLRLNPGREGTQQIFVRAEAQPRGPTPYPSRQRSIFVTDSYFMTVHFQQLKGIQSSKQGM